MQVYLIRHTTPLVEKGICYGQTDLDLEHSQFESELEVIKSKLPNDIEVFFSSPLQRCTYLTQALSSVFKTAHELMEVNFGTWENKRWNDISQDELNPWMADFVHIAPPGGEHYLELYNRTIAFLEHLLQTGYKKVAIVTHAGNIRSIISYILDLPLENSFRIAVEYGSVVNVQLSENKHLCKLHSIQ